MDTLYQNTSKVIIIRLFITLSLFLLFSMPLLAQESFTDFYNHSQKISNTGMYVLGSWAIANIATGTYGWSKYSGNRMYFYQMNLFWNVVNASIAGFALYSNYSSDINSFTQQELIEKLVKTENILLINAGLDIGYIGAGFLLKYLSTKHPKRSSMLKGYGNSVILQGGFLLVFDVVMYGILRADRIDFLDNFNIALLPEGFSIGLTIPIY